VIVLATTSAKVRWTVARSVLITVNQHRRQCPVPRKRADLIQPNAGLWALLDRRHDVGVTETLIVPLDS
jgi:hypothetical protein